MSQLIESIKIYNGRVYNIQYHNKRCNASRSHLFGTKDKLNLRNHINIPPEFKKGLIKCKITYHKEVVSVEYSPYKIRSIKRVGLVYDDKIQFPHKMKLRDDLDRLRRLQADCDEIIIVKNGLLTDAFYYNIVIENDDGLFTPKKPLLPGIMRCKLIQKHKIKVRDLSVMDLKLSKHIYLINALTNLGQIRFSPDQVINL